MDSGGQKSDQISVKNPQSAGSESSPPPLLWRDACMQVSSLSRLKAARRADGGSTCAKPRCTWPKWVSDAAVACAAQRHPKRTTSRSACLSCAVVSLVQFGAMSMRCEQTASVDTPEEDDGGSGLSRLGILPRRDLRCSNTNDPGRVDVALEKPHSGPPAVTPSAGRDSFDWAQSSRLAHLDTAQSTLSTQRIIPSDPTRHQLFEVDSKLELSLC